MQNLLLRRSGYVYAILAAVLFGASTPAAKWLLNDASPWLLAGILYLGSGIGLLMIYVIKNISHAPRVEAPLKGSDWSWLAGSIIFGGILAPVLLLFGLESTEAGGASLLLNLEGVATALLAWFVFKENFDRRIMIGMIAILVGSMILSWTNSFQLSNLHGPLMIAAACMAWGIDNNLTKKISASDALQISMIKGLIAGTTNTLLAIKFGAIDIAMSTVIIGGLVGFLGYGLSLYAFVLSLRQIGAARTGAYFSLAPFIGAFIAVLAGSQEISIQLVLASLIMGYGVWLHLSENHEHAHTHEEMKHEHSHVHDVHHQHPEISLIPTHCQEVWEKYGNGGDF